MTELWLIRHGQTDWNLTGRWQGQVSYAPGLNDLGHAQALSVRDQLMDKHFSAIYSSDLLRARQTADLIAEPLGLTVILESRLREMNLGAWEGMLSSDIEVQYPYELEERKRDPLHAHTPNGESLLEVSRRVIEAINEITSRHPDRSVLVVSHGVSLAVIICRAEGFLMEEAYQHIPDNAQPYCVMWNAQTTKNHTT